MKNKAIIFLNGDKGDISRIRSYITEDTWLIGCDGGTEKILKLGLRPQAIVGDLDSIGKKLLESKDIVRVKHPKDKDYTDSEAAIRYALDRGAEEIILTGLTGSRLDHMLGNIYLLDKQEFARAKLKIVEASQEIYLIKDKTLIAGKKGETISFLPINGDVQALSTKGLKYDLAEYELSLQGNTGISNKLVEDQVEVLLPEDKKLLVIHEVSS
ncbi:MAG TPA: thiamine diphosphokinase [Candidatus Saccharimonadales bacterium]|nr:thiamine diphosphokinase [Candidatus Saccharimonadales bacterium]